MAVAPPDEKSGSPAWQIEQARAGAGTEKNLNATAQVAVHTARRERTRESSTEVECPRAERDAAPATRRAMAAARAHRGCAGAAGRDSDQRGERDVLDAGSQHPV